MKQLRIYVEFGFFPFDNDKCYWNLQWSVGRSAELLVTKNVAHLLIYIVLLFNIFDLKMNGSCSLHKMFVGSVKINFYRLNNFNTYICFINFLNFISILLVSICLFYYNILLKNYAFLK